MKIDMQAKHFTLTRALRDHVQRRLGFALSTGSHHLQRVLVRLSDSNGPRGGTEKRCSIQLILPHQANIVVEGTESSLYAAIDRAAHRAGRTLRRRLTRHRDQYRALQHQQIEAFG